MFSSEALLLTLQCNKDKTQINIQEKFGYLIIIRILVNPLKFTETIVSPMSFF